MDSYPFDSILLNGRDVFIQNILSGHISPENDFEAGTLSFISDWFTNTESFIQYTSGSMGAPKAITITRKQMIESAKMTEQALELKKGQTALVCLSSDYIAGKMMLVRSFVTGMKIVAVTPSANPFMVLPPNLQIDFVALVPAQIHDIVRSAESQYFHTIKTAIIGGAALDIESQEKLQEFRCKFYATYGMAETVSHVALRRLNGKNASDYYTTLPGIAIELDNRQCLLIKWNNLPHYIITNDLAEVIDVNTFRWLGRWDNVINSGGTKLIPEVVEAKIEKIFNAQGIRMSFFVGSLPDQKLGNKVVLLVEGHLSNEMLQLLKSTMKKTFSGVEVPKDILMGISFILAKNGKINRKATINLTSGTIDSSA